MQRIAIYGKGGIGKSTISSNLTAALSDRGVRVMQIGCDPKHDSTRLLTSGAKQETVLDYLKDIPEPHRKLDDIVEKGYKGCLCVEAGGPEPGIGCAGRGIISAFELLQDLGVETIPLDITIYDVLGDVVCGGFAVPLRDNYADTVYIVTSGEFMSIYAANNILRGTSNYDPDRIGGMIFNSRGDAEEDERVTRFSEAVGIPVVAKFLRSREFLDAEQKGMTVVEASPDSNIAASFKKLADIVLEGKKYTARYLSESELEMVVLGRSVDIKTPIRKQDDVLKAKERRRYTSRNVHRNEILHGCAFNGAASVAMSISGLTTIMHSPRSCSQFSFQMVSNSIRRSVTTSNAPVEAFADPDVRCTDMNETSMIFGGADVLESKLRMAVAEGAKNIAVITSCPSGIIGDDVPRIVQNIKNEYPGTSIVVLEEDGNNKGDFMQGVIDASIGLIRSFSEKGLKKNGSVNLVGVKTLATNSRRNIDSVKDILSRMGIELNCACVGNTDIEDLRNMTAADVSMVMYPDRFAIMLKDFLSDEYGMEFTQNVIRPGLNETRKWVREIAERFNIKENGEKVIRELEKEYDELIEPLRNDLKGHSVYVVGNQRDINWIMETVEMTEMRSVGAVIVDLTDHTKDYEIDLDYPVEQRTYGDIGSIISDIRSKRPDIVVSTYSLDLGDMEECYIPVAPDIGPFSGPELAYSWANRLKAPEQEGWRKDVV